MKFSTALLGLVLAITHVSATPIQSISLVLSPPSPTQAPQPPPPSGGTLRGDATIYAAGLGSCGKVNSDRDYIVAISKLRMDETFNSNPNNNIQCGKRIRAWLVPDATTPNPPPAITVSVADRCEACKRDDLDFAPSPFFALGCNTQLGRCRNLAWEWI